MARHRHEPFWQGVVYCVDTESLIFDHTQTPAREPGDDGDEDDLFLSYVLKAVRAYRRRYPGNRVTRVVFQ